MTLDVFIFFSIFQQYEYPLMSDSLSSRILPLPVLPFASHLAWCYDAETPIAFWGAPCVSYACVCQRAGVWESHGLLQLTASAETHIQAYTHTH